MASNVYKHPAPPSLPATVEDLKKDRVVKFDRTLNDHVEAIYLALYPDVNFKRYLYATYDEQAVEGSLAMDNGEAAGMIREYAIKHSVLEVANEKKATIVKALNVVLRRYKKARKQRRDMLGGEIIRDDNNGE